MSIKWKSFLFGAVGAMSGTLLTQAISGASANAAQDTQPTRMGHLIVERLDIVEPDGTLRQVLYSKARDPGAVVRGKRYDHPSRSQSGMLFYNDEGSEVGGLVYAGKTREDGTRSSGGALSFDAYEQDQIVQLIGVKEGDTQFSGVFVSDRPAEQIDFELMDRIANASDPARRRELVDQMAQKDGGAPRGFFGRARNGDAAVLLRDANGHARLELSVSKAGDAAILFKDEDGATVRRIVANE